MRFRGVYEGLGLFSHPSFFEMPPLRRLRDDTSKNLDKKPQACLFLYPAMPFQPTFCVRITSN